MEKNVIARFSTARGIAIDRDAVARPGPRRCVAVDTGGGGRAARFNVHRFTAPRRLSLPFTSITLILIVSYTHLNYNKVALRKVVQRCVLSIQPTEGEPEENSTNA